MIKFPGAHADWHDVRNCYLLPNPYTCSYEYGLVFPRVMEISL